MFAVLGEVLVDLVTQQNTNQLNYYIGGGPYNSALALAKLGETVAFHFPISSDFYGQKVLVSMQENNIQYTYPYLSNLPTSLAICHLDEKGKAHYQFYRDGTAQRDIDEKALCLALPQQVDCLHTGTLAIAQSPDVDIIKRIVQKAKATGVIIAVDPNMRINCFADKNNYRENVLSILALADIIKMSDDDLVSLYPSLTKSEAISFCKKQFKNCLLTIITAGDKEIIAYGKYVSVKLKPMSLSQLGDTIGAGDCFTAGLLHQCKRQGLLNSQGLAKITCNELSNILTTADAVAHYNCRQKGCNPPYRSDIEPLLKSK